jgi:hypothetical protein
MKTCLMIVSKPAVADLLIFCAISQKKIQLFKQFPMQQNTMVVILKRI